MPRKPEKPLSTRQLFEHISPADNAMLRSDGVSAHTKRKARKELLARGFTEKQLSDYVRGEISTIPKPKNPPAKKGKK